MWGFWGRGIVTKWHSYIDPGIMGRVNLSGLTEIQIAIIYEAFLDESDPGIDPATGMTKFESTLRMNKLEGPKKNERK